PFFLNFQHQLDRSSLMFLLIIELSGFCSDYRLP
ncbi:unnamed protein product, partial [Cuscuta campestris]